MSGVLLYEPNNSGGYWWLKTADYEALEAAGWGVTWAYSEQREWYHKPGEFYTSTNIRRYEGDVDQTVSNERTPGLSWLGAEAGSCAKRFASAREGVEEWERITGQDAGAVGCTCCGPPHAFEWTDDETGEMDYISPSLPDRVDLWGD
jgi:hypothetical protein